MFAKSDYLVYLCGNVIVESINLETIMMKRVFLAVIALFMFTVSPAQDTDQQLSPFMQLLSDFLSAYSDKKYSTAAEMGEKLAQGCDTVTEVNPDSLYAGIQLALGRCYSRLNRYEKAGLATDKGADRLRAKGMTKNITYANLLDNAGFYYLSDRQYEKGLQRSLAALDVYSQYPDKAVTQDMQAVYSHIGEGYYNTKKYQDAIVYQIKTLNISEKLNGKHSDDYINELTYLAKYYSAAGEDKKADAVNADIDKLQREVEDGQVDLPDVDSRDFSTAEECHKYNYEAYRCADFFLNHYLSNDNIDKCAKYIMSWLASTKDVNCGLGKVETELLTNDKTKGYAVAYMAAIIKYSIENEDSTFSPDMYHDAFIDMLNYYIANRELTGKVKSLEKYINAYNKGPEELDEMINKAYPGN